MTFYPIYEASNPLEQAANGVALKILTAQKKMGALKGINLKVMSLDDSRKERLKKAGILVGAAVLGSALGYGAEKYEDRIIKKVGSGVDRARGTKVGKGVAGGYSRARGFASGKASAVKATKLGQGAAKQYGNAKGFATDKYNAVKGSKLGQGAAKQYGKVKPYASKYGDAAKVGAAGAALGVAHAVNRNKRYVIIEAKYKYGTKMFQVYSAPDREADNAGKVIIRAVNKEISQLKSTGGFPVKEDFTIMEEHNMLVQELIIEEVLGENIW